ncbi:MAG TPA: OmpA family protein [Burkholderiales bacterium]|nr:OmpA family protein [Burkholderiales bacterium]
MTRTRAIVVAAAAAVLLAGCATEPEKPAPPPAAPVSPPPPQPVAKPAPAPAPVQKPAPAPVAKPTPKKPAVVTLSSTELFDFDKAVLTAEARKKLDDEIVAKARDANVEHVQIDGHADRIGSHPYNQRLSERRADAVRAYLVSRGFNASSMDSIGFGKTNPVKSCPGQLTAQTRKALIECLAPNRRVVVSLRGTPR